MADNDERNRLKRYQTIGPGAAKIAWGTPGDWTRCVAVMTRHVGENDAKEMCSVWHHEQTGLWTGDRRHLGKG